jgi:hypothetical protein
MFQKRRLGRRQAAADATARQHSESACLGQRARRPPGHEVQQVGNGKWGRANDVDIEVTSLLSRVEAERTNEYYIQRPATRAEEDGSTMKDPYLAN